MFLQKLINSNFNGVSSLCVKDSLSCLKILRHPKWVYRACFNHDSTLLASAGKDKTIKIWDVNTGKCIKTLKGHFNLVFCVCFSHDSTLLASTSRDATMKIWDINAGKLVHTFKGPSGTSGDVHFSHDSTLLASLTSTIWGIRTEEMIKARKTIKIWDVNTGKLIHTLKGHSKPVTKSCFNHDSTLIASGSEDCIVRIWDVNTHFLLANQLRLHI